MLIVNNEFFFKYINRFVFSHILFLYNTQFVQLIYLVRFLKNSNQNIFLNFNNFLFEDEFDFFEDELDTVFFCKKNVVNDSFVFFNFFRNIIFLKKKKKALYLILRKKSGILKRNNILKKFVFNRSYAFFKKIIDVENNTVNGNFYETNALSEDNINISKKSNVFDKNILSKKSLKYYFNIVDTAFFYKKHNNNKNNLIKINKKFNIRLYNNRQVIKELFFTLFCRQHQLTKFLVKLSKYKNFDILKKLQSTLLISLVSSQLFLFKQDVIFFLKFYGVYVNGVSCYQPHRILKPGDIIQLPIIDTFFFFFKHTRFLHIYFLTKYKKKFSKLSLTYGKNFLQRSYYMPNWIYKLVYFFSDVPKNIEIDYSMLTFIVLYNPTIYFDTHLIFNFNLSFFLFRLYN